MKNTNVLLVIGSCILILIGILFIGLTAAADKENSEQTQKKVELKQKKSSTTSQIVLNYHLDDRTQECSGEKELIYADQTFKYFLSCYKSSTVYLVYDDGHEVSLKDAITTNLVTIDELINNGLEVIKEAV